ncbi:MAG: polysaccharide deacetylase family protein [Dethiobacteria bacterium]
MTIFIRKERLRLIFGLGLVAAILLLTPLLNLPGRLAAVVGQGERLVPIYYVETDEKKVAFSFDASWGAERTEKILEVLEENEIKTTFFLTGFWVESYPEYVKLIARRRARNWQSYPHPPAPEQPDWRGDPRRIEKG